ncbi:hypothetical protein CC117_08735 [Parafrankia colletiae]|uniref:Uncharacterized protein n=2 Tax=Parafrankia colletiae TaxID=573497 RepID=A0A1S1RM25_9ACTN|nr:hypothetical protein CC117_08735 [Parafrankia colletiae]
MVARELWSKSEPTKVQRSRTRDLSRQFRGEKAIEWRVIEVYLQLLFAAADPELPQQLEQLRLMHVEAFGATVDPDGQPAPETDEPTIDAAYVAELSRQLDEARTRAAFATALLVIVQAENTALRGRSRSFDWFGPAGEQQTPNRSRRRGTAGAAGTADATRAAGAQEAARAAGGHQPGTGGSASPSEPSANSPIDPITAPIARRQAYRAAQRRRSGFPAGGGGEPLPAPVRLPTHTTAPAVPAQVPGPAAGYSLAALTRYRAVPAAPRRAPGAEAAPSDDLGLDILVGREKRRRGGPR